MLQIGGHHLNKKKKNIHTIVGNSKKDYLMSHLWLIRISCYLGTKTFYLEKDDLSI